MKWSKISHLAENNSYMYIPARTFSVFAPFYMC